MRDKKQYFRLKQKGEGWWKLTIPTAFLKQHIEEMQSEWTSFDVNVSKFNNQEFVAKLDTWKPKMTNQPSATQEQDVPF